MVIGSGLLQSALSTPQSGAVLLGGGIAFLSSLSVTIMTALLTRGKFKRELLWDRRQAACNDILSKLQASAFFAEGIREGFDEDVHSFYGSEQLDKLNELYGDLVSAAHDVFHANYLLLPSAFRRRYENMERERRIVQYHFGGPDIYLDQIEANERGRRDLFDLARAELGIAPWWQLVILRCRPGLMGLRAKAERAQRRVRRALKSRKSS